MEKKKTAKKHSKDSKKPLFTNKQIVLIKIGSACLLFFCCCLFFFQSMEMFWNDLKSFNPFPIIFFAGLIFVCTYISILVGHINSKELFKAERLDLVYRIVFSITLIALVIRSFFAKPYLNVPIHIVVLAVVSGIITWITPRIVDNNNSDF